MPRAEESRKQRLPDPFLLRFFPVDGDGSRRLRKDDRLLGVADRFESRFQRVSHRRGPQRKIDGVGTGRRQMPAQYGLGDAARALQPACRRLLQHMITMEARVLARILVPLVSGR